MRLVLRRIVGARALLLAAAAAALVSTVLLTAFLQYALMLPVAGARAAVVASPASDHTLLASSNAGRTEQELAARQAAARQLFSPGLAGVRLRVYAAGHATSQTLPGHDDAEAVVAFMSDLESHADLVDGVWPRVVTGDGPAEATLPVPAANRLGLSVGDEIVVHDGLEREDRRLVLVGVWQPREPDGGYWRLAGAPLGRGGVGPFVLHRDDFTGSYLRLASLEWVAVPADLGALAGSGLGPAVASYQGMVEELPSLRDEFDNPTLRLTSGLPDLAERLAAAEVVNRSGLILPAALVVLIAGYGLVLVARLLAAQRRGENALLRARGASRGRLFGITATEAALVVAPAALLAAPLGTQLVGYADGLAGERGLDLASDLTRYGWWGPPVAWLIALLAAACCALALALPGAGRGRTWVAELRERSRPSRAVRHLRSGVDLALVVMALLAWSQLRQYETTVLFTDSGAALDPLLVAAPVAAVVAATAVALRVLPVATRLAVRLFERGRGFTGLLGAWQAQRRPHAGPVLLLVLAVATAVLAPAVATTWQRSQYDQAAYAVGADVRLSRVDTGASHVLGDLPGVTDVVAVHRGSVVLPQGGGVTLLAVDAAGAPEVVPLRGGDSLTRPEVFAALADGRARLEGVPLSDASQRLVGEVRFSGAQPVTVGATLRSSSGEFEAEALVPGPSGGLPALHFADAAGLVWAVPGRFDPDGVWRVDMVLPPDATALVGLSAQLRVPSLPSLPCPDRPECPRWSQSSVGNMDLAWEWDLRFVNPSGIEVPVGNPSGWDLHLRQRRGGSPLTYTAGAVTARVHPVGNAGSVVPFRVGGTVAEVPTVPAVVTHQVLAELGADVGDQGTVGGIPVQVVDTVPAVPGTDAQAVVLVDLGMLALRRLQDGAAVPPDPQEWWLASEDPGRTAAAAAQSGIAVKDRTALARALLDDPLGTGMLTTLWAAAVGAALLAALGLTVDARTTALGRQQELAVLHTLGAPRRSLARSLVVEQGVLAGLGVMVGGLVGVLVAAAMGPSLILTPAGAAPVPPPVLALAGPQLAALLAGLLLLAGALAALVSRRARRDLATGGLRIGAD